MPLEQIYPDGLRRPPTYAPAVRVTGGRTVYLAGHTPVDIDGNTVGEGDFGAQARQVYENLRITLAALGGDFSNLARMTTYVVDYTTENRAELGTARSAAMGDSRAASTLLGVAALATPGWLIEIEAIAVFD